MTKAIKISLLIALITLVSVIPVLSGTFTDESGRTVTLPNKPERIVALSPWAVEILFALDYPPVGRPSSAVYPEEALQVPAHGTSYRLNYERIIALRPDLIIGNDNLHRSFLDQLVSVNAPVLLYDIDSYQDVLEKVTILGQITGQTKQAAKINSDLETRLSKLTSKLPNKKLTAVVLVGSSEAFSVAKGNSYIGNQLQILGVDNIGDRGPEHRPGFTKLSLEYIAQANPDVIFAVKPAVDPNNPSSALDGYDKNPLWASLSAVQNGRVYELDPVISFMNPGPRIIDSLEFMAQCLYPEVFAGE